MKKIVCIALLMVSLVTIASAQLFAVTKQIHIKPSTAKIFINGDEVGAGTYSYKFTRADDFIILKFEAPGYLKKEVKLFKNNPNKSVSYTLFEDEAELNSVGAGEGVDIANKWFDISAKAGITEDEAWKRLMNVAMRYFDNIETRDKSAGWIKTAWTVNSFSNQKLRTNMEVRASLGDNVLRYRVRISSELTPPDCTNEQCYEKYPRVLKKFERIVDELQASLGGN